MRTLKVVLVIVFAMFVFPSVAQEGTQLTEDERVLAELYQRVSPSIVSISVERRSGASYIPLGTGSGFVVDFEGHVVTNYHVVEGADRIVVNFYDGLIIEATVVGFDPDADLAVIVVDVPVERLVPITFADSNGLFVGQTALAIGSPFGQRWTLTRGIVSALDRTIHGLSQFNVGSVIQTDAAINPGNSGGPLLNLQGEVIGVNTQIISETGLSSGIGFAIPSNLVERVISDLIQFGKVDYSYLGINGVDVDLNIIKQYGIPNDMRGVVITGVLSDGPAGMGGLRDDTDTSVDIVTLIDGISITGFDSLVSYLASNTSPGDTVIMTVYRNGEYIELAIVLGSRLQR